LSRYSLGTLAQNRKWTDALNRNESAENAAITIPALCGTCAKGPLRRWRRGATSLAFVIFPTPLAHRSAFSAALAHCSVSPRP
jgi:hypothetical protein